MFYFVAVCLRVVITKASPEVLGLRTDGQLEGGSYTGWVLCKDGEGVWRPFPGHTPHLYPSGLLDLRFSTPPQNITLLTDGADVPVLVDGNEAEGWSIQRY